MFMQITWSCLHRQRKYQCQYAWREDCLPNEPFQNFKFYHERFHFPDRAVVSTFDPHQLTHRLGWTISSIYFVTPSLDMAPWITGILEFSCLANCWFWMFQDRMTNYINIFTHTDHHFRSQNATSVSLIYLSALECYLLGRKIKLNLSPRMCTSLYGLHGDGPLDRV